MIYKVFALVLLTLCVCTVIKAGNKQLALPVGMIGTLGILLACIPYYAGIVSFFRDYEQQAFGIEIIVKAVAVIVVCELLSDMCRDAGETAMASAVSVFCRAAVMLSVTEALKTIVKMIGGLLQ